MWWSWWWWWWSSGCIRRPSCVPMVVTCRVNTASFPCLLQDAANCDSAPAGGNTYLRVVGDANKHLRTLAFAWCAGHEDESNWRRVDEFIHSSVEQLRELPLTVLCDGDKVPIVRGRPTAGRACWCIMCWWWWWWCWCWCWCWVLTAVLMLVLLRVLVLVVMVVVAAVGESAPVCLA